MDTALNDAGDFALDDRGMPYLLSGLAELMQRVKLCLQIKKGSFLYDRSLGSELHTLERGTELLQQRAQMLVYEAVATVPQVRLYNIQAEFPQDGPLKLSLDIDFAGEKGKLEVTL